MRRWMTARRALELLGLAHLLWLYGYGLLHWRVGTVALALLWILICLTLWRERES